MAVLIIDSYQNKQTNFMLAIYLQQMKGSDQRLVLTFKDRKN
jgi:hypothetical protein